MCKALLRAVHLVLQPLVGGLLLVMHGILTSEDGEVWTK